MVVDKIRILGIESSCDDTAAAVLCNDRVLSNCIASQIIHREYGGVVPELASRAHQQLIVTVVDKALRLAKTQKQDLDAIAFTKGPGLLGALLVGTSFAKSLAMGLDIPLIGVNHMQAHILAHYIAEEGYTKPEFPFLALTISGGHTQIVRVMQHFDMEVIGQTLDDAVGEAFDKVAKMLGFPYPGGILIDRHAQLGDPHAFRFPIPKVDGLDFSFSGLKTAVRNFIHKETQKSPHFVKQFREDICASVQYTIVQILMAKLKKAVQQTQIQTIVIGGGVSANSAIRDALQAAALQYGWTVHIPKLEYTTDNAAMIGIVGYHKYLRAEFDLLSCVANPRCRI